MVGLTYNVQCLIALIYNLRRLTNVVQQQGGHIERI